MMHGLTDDQWAVAELVAACWTVKQIAQRRGTRQQTVHLHIDAIMHRWRLDPTKDARTQIALAVQVKRAT